MWVHKTLIVTDSVVSKVRAIGEQIGPNAAGMWTTPLSLDGAEPPTHWISAGLIGQDFADMLTSPEALHAASALFGIALTLAECQNILANADVSAKDALEAIDRLGLKLVQVESHLDSLSS